MNRATRMLGLFLPAMVVVALAAYVVLGALPGALLTGDFIAAIAQLPVITIHAFAAIGVTWLFNKHTFLDLDDASERQLRDAVREGDYVTGRWAFFLLLLDAARWLLPLVAMLVFFYPAR